MAFEEGLAKSEKAYEKFTEVSTVFAEIVNDEFITTWQWWIGLALFIIPWLVWIKYRKKDSTGRLLLAGLLIIILSLTIDLAALSLGLWSYPLIIIPLAPFLFLPYHFSLAPVGIMFALQIKPQMNSLLKGILFSATAAFGGMNFFNAIDFYNPKSWSTLYDFVIFLTLYYAGYWITRMESLRRLDEMNPEGE
ncbi:CBO0543 family protein [Cytobacillus oceanisediminis]|uniref:CBO0543 family protein n=1 Tax=Cytobacillus oceanisediminis TaxID=665099 RepID=UPI002495A0C9|nr:CBO0543 family protein [Cytobacillus oceanisediminis]